MSERAAELRAAFDGAFAAAPAPEAAPQVDLLRVRIGGEAYAIALAELAGFHADVRVVPLPSPAAELLGVAAIRGALVPVYDLRVVLGGARGPASRWLALAQGAPPLALAFDQLDGHARALATELAPATGTPIRGALRLHDRLHQLLDIASIRSVLHTRWDRKG